MSSFDDIFGDTSDLMAATTPSTSGTSVPSSSISLEGLGLDDLDLGDLKPSTSSTPAVTSDPSDFLDWLDQKPTTTSTATPTPAVPVVEVSNSASAAIADPFSLDDDLPIAPAAPSASPGNPFAGAIPPSVPVSTPAPVTPVPATVLSADPNVFSAPPPMPVATTKQPTPSHSNPKSASATTSQTNATPPHSVTHSSISAAPLTAVPTPPHSATHTSISSATAFSATAPPSPPHSNKTPPHSNKVSTPPQTTNGTSSSHKQVTPPHTNNPFAESGSQSAEAVVHSPTPPVITMTTECATAEAIKANGTTTNPSVAAGRVFDVRLDTLRSSYRQANKIPPSERLHAWNVLLEAKPQDPVSLSASAAPATDEMKKDAEAICSVLFGDATFCNVLKQEGVPVDAARLSMSEHVEQLLRALCATHKLVYYPKLGSLYTPLLALSSGDPLRPDIFGVMDAITTRLVPSLIAHVPSQAVAEARRPLMKLLLLYHDPTVALHLDHTLPQWNDGTLGILPDSWMSSLFEGTDHTNTMPLPALSNIWDCCVVNASSTYPSIIGVFIVLHAILQSKKRLLSLTNATTLRTVMMQLLVETLGQSPQLLQHVHDLIEKTPFSFCTKICDAGIEVKPLDTTKSTSRTNSTTNNSVTSPRTASKDQMDAANNGAAGMSKLSASFSSMNSKFFSGASKLTASIMTTGKSTASSSASSGSDADRLSSRSESFHLETAAVYFSMTISACEVIPSVFRGFKSACTEKIRYFIVDCRPEEYLRHGRIPTSFAFNSESLMDPSAFDAVMATLQPLKSSVHICILGHGYARHASHMIKDLNMPKSLVADMLAKDAAQINDAVMFLAKRGFPYVSVVEGGYASTHRFLTKSRLFSLSDLTDHDPKECDLCSQDAALKHKGGRSASHHSDEEDEYIQRTEGGVCLGRFGPDGRKRTSTAPRSSVTSPTTSYFSSMTSALKDSTKTMAAVSSKTLKAVPGSNMMSDAFKDSTSWMMKKAEAIHLNEVSSTMSSTVTSGMRSVVDVAANPATSLKKAANSFASTMGNAEPPMMPPMRSSSTTGPAAPVAAASSASMKSASASTAATKRAAPSKAKEAVFSIDDDDEEESDSFMGGGEPSADESETQSAAPVIIAHTVKKGGIADLKKGMQIRMPELLPLVSSPLFSCYKKKTRGTDTLMLPRHVVIAEGHIVVLKTDKVQEDVRYVRSCHHLSHIGRMTCMKKNALMVTLYLTYDDKNKQNSYEVQQRDAFIKVVRSSMEVLAAEQKADDEA
ncbi:Aste57867_12073 [Aphanomyces stellatus]|uniref:Aste57867_12073 protein n=1 Tax=Aphanomyces stellatus TaxID=120398 RepID=A0A485KV73_9STRA|nr:hypothetical protein As57867_012028 [Aphanomyces stellatus]VFT88928.1 Aste57867_12073 [Aphanomyces stellatus]